MVWDRSAIHRSVRIPEHLDKWLIERAHHLGCNVSALIKMILTEAYREHMKRHEEESQSRESSS